MRHDALHHDVLHARVDTSLLAELQHLCFVLGHELIFALVSIVHRHGLVEDALF